MIKKINLFILLTTMFACTTGNTSDTYEKRKPIPFKPFYVYNKIVQNEKSTSMYDCVDKNGTRFWFMDLTSKYSVGDSIK